MKNFQSNLPCEVCGQTIQDNYFHHILTKKSRPDVKYKEFNLISVCQEHHNDFESKGNNTMSKIYPHIRKLFIDRGFYMCETSNKWRYGYNNERW